MLILICCCSTFISVGQSRIDKVPKGTKSMISYVDKNHYQEAYPELWENNSYRNLLDTLEQGSLCALGGGLPLPVKNALMYFDEELSSHFNS